MDNHKNFVYNTTRVKGEPRQTKVGSDPNGAAAPAGAHEERKRREASRNQEGKTRAGTDAVRRKAHSKATRRSPK